MYAGKFHFTSNQPDRLHNSKLANFFGHLLLTGVAPAISAKLRTSDRFLKGNLWLRTFLIQHCKDFLILHILKLLF